MPALNTNLPSSFSPAGININLVPMVAFEKKPLGKFLQWALTYGRYIVIGTEIIVLMAFFSRFKFDRELTDLHELVDQKEAIVASAQGLEEDKRLLDARLAQIKELDQKSSQANQILKLFEGIVPQDVFLNELSFDQERLTLAGNAISTFGFNTFLTNLSNSGKFSKISLEDVSRSRGELGTSFKLTCYLKRAI